MQVPDIKSFTTIEDLCKGAGEGWLHVASGQAGDAWRSFPADCHDRVKEIRRERFAIVWTVSSIPIIGVVGGVAKGVLHVAYLVHDVCVYVLPTLWHNSRDNCCASIFARRVLLVEDKLRIGEAVFDILLLGCREILWQCYLGNREPAAGHA